VTTPIDHKSQDVSYFSGPSTSGAGKQAHIARVTAQASNYTVSQKTTQTQRNYNHFQSFSTRGRGDFPAFTPAEAGTRFSDPGG